MATEKLSTKEKAAIRNSLYEVITDALEQDETVLQTEAISTGMLVHLSDGVYAEVRVVVKNEDKFDLAVTREKYAEKTKAAAERAERAAARALERAQKAEAKVAKESTED